MLRTRATRSLMRKECLRYPSVYELKKVDLWTRSVKSKKHSPKYMGNWWILFTKILCSSFSRIRRKNLNYTLSFWIVDDLSVCRPPFKIDDYIWNDSFKTTHCTDGSVWFHSDTFHSHHFIVTLFIVDIHSESFHSNYNS